MCPSSASPCSPPTFFFFFFDILEFLDCFSITVPWGGILVFLAWIRLREGRRYWSVSAQSSVHQPGPSPIPHHVQFIPPSFLFRLEGAEGKRQREMIGEVHRLQRARETSPSVLRRERAPPMNGLLEITMSQSLISKFKASQPIFLEFLCLRSYSYNHFHLLPPIPIPPKLLTELMEYLLTREARKMGEGSAKAILTISRDSSATSTRVSSNF